MEEVLIHRLQEAQRHVERTKEELAQLTQANAASSAGAVASPENASSEAETVDTAAFTEVAVVLPEDTTGALDVRKDIYHALKLVSEPLARGYAQVKKDLADTERLSWMGSANEIREVLGGLLRELAPDNDVEAQKWYKPEPNTKGPSQKQRVRYIAEKNHAGSREREVAEMVGILDKRIEDMGILVRSVYSRANAATHRSKERREVVRIVGYFEAFAHDLLNLD